ncbi:MAG: hypothetical protein WC891_01395 [Actinomycetota bacterium]
MIIAAVLYFFVSGSAVAVVNGGGHTVVSGSSATFGNTVAWTDLRIGSNPQVYYRNLPSGADVALYPSGNFQASIAIYGSIIVWHELGDLYYKDINRDAPAGPAHRLTTTSSTSKSSPQIFGDRVVWAQTESGRNQIYTKRLGDSGNGTPLAPDAGFNQGSPVIYGDYVVWTESPYGGVGFNLKAKNITTGTTGSLCTATEDQVAPAIYGTVAVWVDSRIIIDWDPGPIGIDNRPVQQIYYYDLKAGLPLDPVTAGTRLSSTSANQTRPTVSGRNIAWLETRSYDGNPITDIYLRPIGGAETRVTTTNGLDHGNPSMHQNLIYEEQAFNSGSYSWDIMQGSAPASGALSSVTVTPADATLKAAGTQAFYAQGHDANFNPVVTTFSWSATGGTASPTPGDATVYTAGSTFGDFFTITAASGGFQDSSAITIMQTPLDHVTIIAGPDTVQAGGTATYSAKGYDDAGIEIPGLTYNWSASVGSIAPTGVFTAPPETGPCQITVSATSGATKTATKGITIYAGPLDHLDITPGSARVLHGASLNFSVQGQDVYHNDIAGLTYNWSAVNGSVAPTTGSATTYTAPATGTSGTITVTSGVKTQNAIITLTYLDHIVLTPGSLTLQAGTSQAVSAVGYDADNNVISGLFFDWTATGGTVLPATGGSTTFTAQTTPGSGFTITASSGAKSSTPAPITINPGPLDRLHITPAAAAVSAGGTQPFSVQGEDIFGNSISGLTYTWTATGGSVSPGTGSSTTFTAQTTPGSGFTITASSGAKSSTPAPITINPGPLNHIDVTPSSAILLSGATSNFTASGQDVYHNAISGLPYIWSATGGGVSATGPSMTYTAWTTAGTYQVTATANAVPGSSAVTIPAIDTDFPNGRVIKLDGSSAVYFVDGGKKRPISSGLSFISNAFSWDKIKTVTQPVFDNIPLGEPVMVRPGMVVKGPNDPACYVTDNDGDLTTKHPIGDAGIFSSYGLRWEDLIVLTQGEIDALYDRPPISYMQTHPNGMLVQVDPSPAVYFIENGHARPIGSAFAFDSWGLRWDRVLKISATELTQYTPPSEFLTLRTGTLVKGSGSGVFIIDCDSPVPYKRPISSGAVFTTYGLSWSDIKTISDPELDAYVTISPL